MLRLMRKGQSTAEYAIVIGLVLAAVLAMQVYVRRGIQGKIKLASDNNITYNGSSSYGDYGVNTVDQYEPKYATTTAMISVRNSTENVAVNQGGVKREIIGTDTSSRTGKQEILDVSATNK